MTFKIAVSIQYHKIDAMLLVLTTVVHIGSWSQWSRCSAEEHIDERSWSPSRLFFLLHLSLLMSGAIMLFPPSPKQESSILLILLILFSFVGRMFCLLAVPCAYLVLVWQLLLLGCLLHAAMPLSPWCSHCSHT